MRQQLAAGFSTLPQWQRRTDMALDLKIGEQVGLPPADEKTLILDAAGDPFLLTSDGTREEIGGGGGGAIVIEEDAGLSGDGTAEDPLAGVPASALVPGTMAAADFSKLAAFPTATGVWWLDVMRRIQEIDPTLSLAWMTDCNNITDTIVLGTAVGTGAAALESTSNGGSILTSTGTTNNSARTVEMRDAIVTSPASRLVSNVRTQKWAIYKRAQIVAAAGATGKQNVMANVQDGTNDNYLGVHGATSAVNWAMLIGGAGTDLGVAYDLNIHSLLLYNDGTDIHAYLDWTEIGAAVAASGAAATAGYPRWYDSNATTGQNVSHRTFEALMAVVRP
jgi:hypothetical protein